MLKKLLSLLLLVPSLSFAGMFSCSGFFISTTGDIATAKHCVPKNGRLLVIQSNGTETPASIVGVSSSADVAIIHINASTPYLVINAQVHVADTVSIAGFPNPEVEGPNMKLNQGYIVAFKDGELEMNAYTDEGNSGGPVVNTNNEVEGVLVAGMMQPGVSGTMDSYAVSSTDLIALLTQYKINATIVVHNANSIFNTAGMITQSSELKDKVVFIIGQDNG